jgi:hypothetical protein
MWAHQSALAGGDSRLELAVVLLVMAGLLLPLCAVAAGWAQEVLLRRKNPPAPPTSPSNMFYNAFVSRMDRLRHFHRMTEWGLRHSHQDAASGVVVRVPMPRAAPHFVIGDYKLARLVLSGSADGSMPECEKTDLIQRLNIRSDVGNLLTYVALNLSTMTPSHSQLTASPYSIYLSIHLSLSLLYFPYAAPRPRIRSAPRCVALSPRHSPSPTCSGAWPPSSRVSCCRQPGHMTERPTRGLSSRLKR